MGTKEKAANSRAGVWTMRGTTSKSRKQKEFLNARGAGGWKPGRKPRRLRGGKKVQEKKRVGGGESERGAAGLIGEPAS